MSDNQKRKCPSPSPTTTGASELQRQIACHDELVEKCTKVATQHGFFTLYRHWEDELNEGAHSFNGPLSLLIKIHLAGEADAAIAAIYDVLAEEGGVLQLPPKDEFVKPTGTNLLALRFLASINIGATEYFQDQHQCWS